MHVAARNRAPESDGVWQCLHTCPHPTHTSRLFQLMPHLHVVFVSPPSCFFLMPLIDTFPQRLREELEGAWEVRREVRGAGPQRPGSSYSCLRRARALSLCVCVVWVGVQVRGSVLPVRAWGRLSRSIRFMMHHARPSTTNNMQTIASPKTPDPFACHVLPPSFYRLHPTLFQCGHVQGVWRSIQRMSCTFPPFLSRTL